MDEIDYKIINILKNDGRAAYVDIGKRTGLSEGAVRKRISSLIKSGDIKKFTIQVGFKTGAKAITLLSVNPEYPTSEISQELVKISNVETVHEITGQYDIAVMISASSITEVNKCVEEIRRVRGVSNTNTMIILREW
ncbi:MAG: Lrp/AsnC family transcriptional regulator [Candidatus Bathyarchaeia archaeon]